MMGSLPLVTANVPIVGSGTCCNGVCDWPCQTCGGLETDVAGEKAAALVEWLCRGGAACAALAALFVTAMSTLT